MALIRSTLFLFLLFIGHTVNAQPSAPTKTVSGYLGGDVTLESYHFQFDIGDTVLVMAETTTDTLDPVLKLYDSNNRLLTENDDYNGRTFNSALVYSIIKSGEYIVTVERYEDTDFGEYTVSVTVGDDELYDYLDSISRFELSGTPLILDTEHFRIHYTRTGADDTTEAHVEMLSAILEEVWSIQIDEMGWPAPPSDSLYDDDPRYDVFVGTLKKDENVTTGFTQSVDVIGDNPHTTAIEAYAGTSYMVIENDFSESLKVSDRTDVPGLMRSTVAHNFHYAIQMGLDYAETHRWYTKASAAWMEVKTYPDVQDAVWYLYNMFEYPEICFGTENDPTEGLIGYSDWLFIQSLVDAHGESVVQNLWKDIAEYEQFEPLEKTLSDYLETVPEALARYRIQNLARDYELAPQFNTTVWLEADINRNGEWTHSGEGVQELGANYFAFKQRPGSYQIKLNDESGVLELWVIGVGNDEVEAFSLGNGGIINTSRYNFTYLMVFNPVYDNDLSDCTYYTYSLRINGAASSAATSSRPIYSFSASNFEPLTLVE